MSGGLLLRPGETARLHGASFFICQPEISQDVVNRLNRTLQAQSLPHLLEGKIRVLGQHDSQLASVGIKNDRLASTTMVLRRNVANMATLLNQLLDHTERNIEATRYLLTRCISSVIGFKDPFAEVQ